MGDVFLARAVTADRLVAMKFLRFPGDPGLFDRFLLELQVLARLDHPNVVRVLAHDFLRADPFFTMEYLEAGSLSEQLKKRLEGGGGPFAPDEAVRIARAVAAALAAAHALDSPIIHRDLKPSNLLLAADGTPKVADFGLAKCLDEVDPLTLQSGGLGTPSYMPPEQLSRRYGALGPWSDVYGLGATLYHLLTGRAPFVGDSYPEILAQVPTAEPDRPRAVRPGIPLGLEAIVLKCLEKRPELRYQSMAELIADLDRYEQKRRTGARARTRWARAKRWAMRNRRGIALAIFAVVSLTGAFMVGNGKGTEFKPKPANPWDAVRAELAAGREVTLIPATGEPQRWEWRLGSAAFGPSSSGDGCCYFEAIDRALLDLLDDPGIDRYRIRADLRQVRSATAPHAEAPRGDESQIGLYFGRTTGVALNGDTVHAFFRVSFHDYDPHYRATGKLTQQAARFERVLSVVGPQRPPQEPGDTFAACAYLPAVRRPGN
jgi:serine/threonine-protein kinase